MNPTLALMETCDFDEPTGYAAWGHIERDVIIAEAARKWESDYDEKFTADQWKVEHTFAKEPDFSKMDTEGFVSFEKSPVAADGFKQITFCTAPEVIE